MRRHILVTIAAAGIITAAAPLAAYAAAVPQARLTLAHRQIAAGHAAALTYSVAGAPAGSVSFLQARRSGAAWQTVAGPLGRSGEISAPGTPAGKFQFRIVVTDAGRRVAVSRIADLLVRSGQDGGEQASSTFSWGSVLSGVADGAAGALVTWLLGLLFTM